MTVAAVVVSFNRKDLLRRCLVALEAQGSPLDEIIVVDNGSTDGSPDLVRTEFPHVFLYETKANLGGAGGFAWGIELAIQRGHDFAWLMDDDAEPEANSLAPLLEIANKPQLSPGFVASRVTDQSGSQSNSGHPAVVDPDPQHQIMASEVGCVAVTQATFVGVLVKLEYARQMALPYADFFIWFDDAEYTRRLAQLSLGLYVPSSIVRHPDKPANPDMAGRLFYYVRNHIWLSKLYQGPDKFEANATLKALRVLGFALRIFAASQSKKLWASSLARGLWQGLTRAPRRVMPGELAVRSKRTAMH